MSGIFGFINMDGRPTSAEHFQKMADEMAVWGPDGVGSIISGSAAFGHALLIVTHESRFEKMPVQDHDEGILFTAAARLDNRDELCDMFSIPHPQRPTTSDGQLVLKAYKKWGSESCKHIFGDWSFAAWHINEHRLFLARDHLGNTGLYYYFKPPLIAFASNPKALLKHHKVPCEIDEIQLARKLGLNIKDKEPHRTCWKDIRSLPAAYSVWFIHNEKKIVNFWRIEDAPEIRFSHDQDYIDGFIEHFRRAVQVRLNSIRPIGTQLSAGLDSSSVTALAAQALLETNQPLVAYTSVPIHPVENIFPGRLTNEWPLAHQVAERYTNIEHIPIKSEDISPLEAAKLIVNILHEPQHAATNMFWIISIFENAKSRNIGVMLTGQLGNGGVSWSGGRDYIFYLFARNQWQKGLRALTAWKKHHGFSWHKAIKNQILRPVLFPFMFEYQRVLHPDKQTNFTYSFPKKEFIQQMGLTENDIINIQSKSIDPLTERILTSTRNGMVVGFIWNSFGSYYNMDVRDPTSDIRLLEFCMGIPDEQFVFEGGDRMLIRRAMCGILPDSIRQNICKGRQAADAFIRIIHDYKEMERALALLETSPAVTQYLDVQAIKSTLDSLGFPNTRTPPLAANALIRAINTGHFLLSFSSYT